MRQLLSGALEGVGDALTAQMLRYRVVLLDELVNGHEATSNSDDQIAILHLHNDLLGEVAVVTFRFSHEETLHALL